MQRSLDSVPRLPEATGAEASLQSTGKDVERILDSVPRLPGATATDANLQSTGKGPIGDVGIVK